MREKSTSRATCTGGWITVIRCSGSSVLVDGGSITAGRADRDTHFRGSVPARYSIVK
jgi:hypothetical protein